MNPEVNNWLQLIFRWGHVVAGVMWIGHLWFFNFVNGPFAAKMDGPTKKLVVPELMPRALFWFRWGAAWTWITGFLLLGLVFYSNRTVLLDNPDKGWGLGAIVMVAVTFFGVILYDILAKSGPGKNIKVLATVGFVLIGV